MLKYKFLTAVAPVLTGGTEATTGILDNVLQGAETMLGFGGMVIDYVFEHPVLVVFAGVGFLGLGISVARKFMGMAKSAGR